MDAAAAPASGLLPADPRPDVEPGRARLGLALILVLALALRWADFTAPWSGSGGDFRSQFGGFATGGPARNFAQHGFLESRLMPFYWRIELADGSTDYGWYAHHPALFAVLTGLSLKVFGVAEWAARLPWLAFDLLSIVSLYRLGALLWSRRLALAAAFWCAVLPLSVFVGTMVWVDTAVVWLQCLLVRQYVLWLRTERGKHLALASAWAWLGGMFEWTSLFVLPALGLHALFFCTRRGGVRMLLRALAIPAGAVLALALHKLHMALVLPAVHAGEAESTLAWVTQLHGDDTVGSFVRDQARYLERYLTWPILVSAALALLLQLGRGVRGRLSREDWLVPALVTPGLIYVGCFPARSTNHDFFFFLSVPWVCLSFAAWNATWLAQLGRAGGTLRRVGAVLWLVLVLWVAGERSFMLWAVRYSKKLERLVRTEWLAPVLADEDVVLFPLSMRWLPLHFYARAAVVHEHTSGSGGESPLTRFTRYREQVLRRLGPEKRVLVLLDPAELAEAGYLAQPEVQELLTFIEAHGHRSDHALPPGGPRDQPRPFVLYDVSEWARGG